MYFNRPVTFGKPCLLLSSIIEKVVVKYECQKWIELDETSRLLILRLLSVRFCDGLLNDKPSHPGFFFPPVQIFLSFEALNPPSKSHTWTLVVSKLASQLTSLCSFHSWTVPILYYINFLWLARSSNSFATGIVRLYHLEINKTEIKVNRYLACVRYLTLDTSHVFLFWIFIGSWH